jgi:organic hydroperoxide reductase OsmC/OhrA
MQKVQASFRSLNNGESAIGQAGRHTIVADRPDGKAGGQGLGFNGAELLALALGGCFCNDMRYIAHRLGRPIATLLVEVDLHLDGDPIMATGAEMIVTCTMANGSEPSTIVAEAIRVSMVANSLMRGVRVAINSRSARPSCP